MADLTITAANVVWVSGSSPLLGIIGETVTAGQAVYLKSSDSRLWKAQADGTSEEATAVGVLLNGGSAGQMGIYAPVGATINIGATTVKTTTYLVSATAGGVCPQADISTTGHYHSRIGYATATTGTFVVEPKNTGVTM